MGPKEVENASSTLLAEASVRIDRPPDRLFAVLVDVGSHTDWARGPSEIRSLSENPVQLGSTWEQVSKLVGKTMVANCQVHTLEENRKFGFTADKPFPFEIAFTLEPTSNGETDVQMVAGGDPGGFFKMTKPILKRTLESQMEADLLSLKAMLEADT
jgi:uncharacterized protein YndB with AHSA1/START domain